MKKLIKIAFITAGMMTLAACAEDEWYGGAYNTNSYYSSQQVSNTKHVKPAHRTKQGGYYSSQPSRPQQNYQSSSASAPVVSQENHSGYSSSATARSVERTVEDNQYYSSNEVS